MTMSVTRLNAAMSASAIGRMTISLIAPTVELARRDRAPGRRHLAAISATVTSSIRFEKPHSLSYQLDAFTSRPDTFVSVASNVDDAGSWLKSIDTSGALL